MSATLFSLAFGVGTQNRQGTWLEVFYAQPLLNPSAELVAAVAPILGYTEGNQAIAAHLSAQGKACATLEPIPASAYPTPAARPQNSRLDCSKLARAVSVRLPPWISRVRARYCALSSSRAG